MAGKLTYYIAVDCYGKHCYLDGDGRLRDDMAVLIKDNAYLIYKRELRNFHWVGRLALCAIDEYGNDFVVEESRGLAPLNIQEERQ